MLTFILSSTIYQLMVTNNLLPSEHNGCRKGSYGCKDQLLINKTIMEVIKSRKRNLTTAWIDNEKPFDSVPHKRILNCCKLYKILPVMKEFIKSCMKKWKTTLYLNHHEGTLSSSTININNGISQLESLSSLLFCIALAPLSSLINDSGYDFKIGTIVLIHLFYMDDLRTFAKNDENQQSILTIVKGLSMT